MGGGRWDTDTWTSYATSSYGTADRGTLRSKSTASMFSARALDPTLDPSKVKDSLTGTRESRDNDDNPRTSAIMLFSDVTGSMGHTAQEVLTGMETVCSELYDRKPVSDPAILVGAIGDMFCDRAPLQVGQFENDIRIVDGTRKLFIEGGGGGNFGESYAAAWLFAAMQTSTDNWEKRGEKGILFTIGDEPCLGAKSLMGKSYGRSHADGVAVTRAQAKQFMGLDIQTDLSAEDCYDMAAQKWEIFHICVNKRYEQGVKDSFGAILGDRLIWLQDVSALPELVVSLVQMVKGATAADVAASWSGGTAVAIADAVGALATTGGAAGAGGVARL